MQWEAQYGTSTQQPYCDIEAIETSYNMHTLFLFTSLSPLFRPVVDGVWKT